MSIPVAEYPYIRVSIDTRGLQPVATRAFGNVAVVGDAGGFGTAVAGSPEMIGSEADARRLFADVDASGAISNGGADAGPLYRSLRDLLAQSPGPSRIYAVATADGRGRPGLRGRARRGRRRARAVRLPRPGDRPGRPRDARHPRGRREFRGREADRRRHGRPRPDRAGGRHLRRDRGGRLYRSGERRGPHPPRGGPCGHHRRACRRSTWPPR